MVEPLGADCEYDYEISTGSVVINNSQEHVKIYVHESELSPASVGEGKSAKEVR